MQSGNVGLDVFFVLVGAILVFAMHGGFAFLETGTVRHKNQVNALVKIIVDFAFSTIAYFFVGYWIAYGISFLMSAADLTGASGALPLQGFALVKFFFLATFAAAVPAIISGGIAERARFWPQVFAAAVIVGLIYPFFEGLVWNGNFGLQAWLDRDFWRADARFRRLDRRSCRRRLAGARRRPAARRPHRPLRPERPADPALLDSLAGARYLAALHRLVRLQRHVGAVDRRRFRPRRDQLADGHGRRHRLGDRSSGAGPRLRPQRRPGRARRGLRRLRRHAPDRRAGHRRRSPASSSFTASP